MTYFSGDLAVTFVSNKAGRNHSSLVKWQKQGMGKRTFLSYIENEYICHWAYMLHRITMKRWRKNLAVDINVQWV